MITKVDKSSLFSFNNELTAISPRSHAIAQWISPCLKSCFQRMFEALIDIPMGIKLNMIRC